MSIEIGSSTKLLHVVCDPMAPAAERFAARELVAVLKQMCGCPVTMGTCSIASANCVNLLIGTVAERQAGGVATPLLEDEIAVSQVGPSTLALRGGGPRGVLYAVYELLDYLGVRWYHPQVTVLPQRQILRLPARLHYRPAFAYREAFWSVFVDDKRFAARQRINGSIIGVPSAWGGHWGWHPYVHSFFKIIPPERYARRHPEYFSYRQGQGRISAGGQLCLSNPDVIDLCTAFALEKMADPMVRIVDISQNDCANPCACPTCATRDRRAGSHAGSILAACNEIATRTSRIHPDKFIGTIAYTYSFKPPRGIEAHPNVIVRLCHMNNECQTHPLDGCAANRAFLEALRQWRQICGCIYVWDYVTNFQHLLALHPNFNSLRADLRLLHDAGVCGVFQQGYPVRGTSFAALHAYAMGRCLWNPKRDYFVEARTFLAAYYGAAAAPHLWRMIKSLHCSPGPDFHLDLYRHPHRGLYAPAGLAAAERHFVQARAAAGSECDPRRLDEVSLWMDFSRMAAAPAIVHTPGALQIRAAGTDASARYRRVRQRIGSFGIRRICEFPSCMNDLRIAWEWSVRDRDLPLLTLQDAHTLVTVSPELNGAVCTLCDRRTGHDFLCKPDPQILAYPYMTGIVAGIRPAQGTEMGLRVFDRWRVMAHTSRTLVISLALGNGLHLSRRITLLADTAGLGMRTTLTNKGTTPFTAAGHNFALYRAGCLNDVEFYKRDATGTSQPLHNAMRAGASMEQWVNLSGHTAPRWEWGFFNARLGLGISETLSRAIAFAGSNGYRETQHILTETTTRLATIPSGSAITWRHDFRVLRQPPRSAK